MEDDFYATIKLKNGEEIFCKVSPSEEEDRTLLLVSNPIMVSEVSNKMGPIGYRLEPWLKTTEEDLFIIDQRDVLTMTESVDKEMIQMYTTFLTRSKGKFSPPHYKLGRSMGSLGTVSDAKNLLEKLYNQ
tara:strand:- start:356 stop:745 length:390 start_codon:yes stop_codon:yes gene_type:complete